MANPKLVEKRNELDAKTKKLHEIFTEGKTDNPHEIDFDNVKCITGTKDEKLAEVRRLNEELNSLSDEVKSLYELDEAAKKAAGFETPRLPAQQETRTTNSAKSIGEQFTESKAFAGAQSRTKGVPADIDIEVKTLFQTSAGWAADDFRGPRVVDYATRPVMVVDLIPQTRTNASSISYMEETTFTNNAAEVAEAGTKPEAALALTERTDTVRKIAVWLPVTDEQLEDVPRVQDYLNNRLGFMVRQRLESQILVGDGTAPNLSGITDRSGIQTQAKGADSTPDAIYKAITKIRVNDFSEPNAYVTHPNDWQPIRLLTTSDGIYIWGPPMDAGPDRIWGLRVVQTTAMTENTGLVGDFMQAELALKKGLTLDVTDSHSDYFIKNQQVIRAEMRASLAVYRPAAFCTVTGI